VIMGASPEKLRIDMREVEEKRRESSSSDFLISETIRREEEEQSPSTTEDFTAKKNVDDGDKKIRPVCAKQSRVSGSSKCTHQLFAFIPHSHSLVPLAFFWYPLEFNLKCCSD